VRRLEGYAEPKGNALIVCVLMIIEQLILERNRVNLVTSVYAHAKFLHLVSCRLCQTKRTHVLMCICMPERERAKFAFESIYIYIYIYIYMYIFCRRDNHAHSLRSSGASENTVAGVMRKGK
jgi:hypothetical protein